MSSSVSGALSEQQLAAFAEAYRADFGVDLDPKQVLDQALRTLRLFELVAKAEYRSRGCRSP